MKKLIFFILVALLFISLPCMGDMGPPGVMVPAELTLNYSLDQLNPQPVYNSDFDMINLYETGYARLEVIDKTINTIMSLRCSLQNREYIIMISGNVVSRPSDFG